MNRPIASEIDRFILVLAPSLWRGQLPLLARNAGRGYAPLVRNVRDGACEFIAQSLTVSQDVANRQHEALSRREDTLVVVFDAACERDTPARLIEAMQPEGDRAIVALCLGTGATAGRWVGSVQQSDQRSRLHELHLVGPSMHRFQDASAPEPPWAKLDDVRDSRRPGQDARGESRLDPWSRTRGALGAETWQKLRSSRVAVVGAGRNGSCVALALGLLGVHRLTLIDPDRDEPHNRDANPLPSPMVMGRAKVFNRRDALALLLPERAAVEIEGIAESVFDAAAIEAIRPTDLIVTAVDDDAPRLAATVLAQRWAKPHLDLGTGVLNEPARSRMGADLRLCLPGEACLVCLGGLRDRDDAERVLAAPRDALRHGPYQPWHARRAGSLLTINQVAVHLGIQLWLDLLAGSLSRSTWYHMEWRNDGIASLDVHQQPDPTCHYCRRS